MSHLIDMTGRRVGKLLVLRRAENQGTRAMWICKCDCGEYCIARGSELRSGCKTDCGCSGKERTRKAVTKHGDSTSRLYRMWRSMLNRCERPRQANSKYYHDKGITVCQEWHDYLVFKEWALANGYDPNAKFGECTLDRIDGSTGYSPENCRWVSIDTQNKHRSEFHTHTVQIAFNGVTKYLDQWASEYNIPYKTLWARINVRKWSIEKALTTPVRGRSQLT